MTTRAQLARQLPRILQVCLAAAHRQLISEPLALEPRVGICFLHCLLCASFTATKWSFDIQHLPSHCFGRPSSALPRRLSQTMKIRMVNSRIEKKATLNSVDWDAMNRCRLHLRGPDRSSTFALLPSGSDLASVLLLLGNPLEVQIALLEPHSIILSVNMSLPCVIRQAGHTLLLLQKDIV